MNNINMKKVQNTQTNEFVGQNKNHNTNKKDKENLIDKITSIIKSGKFKVCCGIFVCLAIWAVIIITIIEKK